MKIQRLIRTLLTTACFFASPLAYCVEVSAAKWCQEIASFIASAGAFENVGDTGRILNDLNCASARRLPADAPLELTRTKWNFALQRWEFVLRCARPGGCVPFLVWAHAENPQGEIANSHTGQAKPANSAANTAVRLVKTGQTALLTWDRGGIRIVLSVTCLDAGSLGQTVRVRLKTANRILRAEVTGAGAVTANL